MTRLTLRNFLIGKPRDPFSAQTRHSIALVAFMAWVGLGADGLSSSSYGPAEAFKALEGHTELGLFLAIASALTVFVISLAYNQIIELFPTGGGGYRIATQLLGPRAGLVSGSALIVDYVLTVAISIAAGTDAVFSLLPAGTHGSKLIVETVMVALLTWLNLRGAKESIRILLPIFLGFVITHAIMIVYGILAHAEGLPALVPHTIQATTSIAEHSGWLFVIALFLKAYSLGGGTYTGIEAVSNNVHTLAEPRVRTGKLTMMYMAASLAFTAGGVILLYLLWDAKPVPEQTLNAVVFKQILHDMGFSSAGNTVALTVIMVFEAGLLFVAANTGFLGGPAVISNLAADSWVPHQFRYLSTRLVTDNGVFLMGAGALGVLLLTGGHVEMLVVLYSINVFLTFSLSLAGLCSFWLKHRRDPRYAHRWVGGFALSALGLSVTATILVSTTFEKFFDGGWVTLLITGAIIATCLAIRKHYDRTQAKLEQVDSLFAAQPFGSDCKPPAIDPHQPTAVFIVGSRRGGGLHALLWVQRMFPGHFKNFIFIRTRTVDAQAYGGQEQLEAMKTEAATSLNYFVNFCHSHGMAAKSCLSFGTDAVEEINTLCARVAQEYPQAIFFTSKLIFERENWLTRLLHNQAALAIQRRLHLEGIQMVILPMKI